MNVRQGVAAVIVSAMATTVGAQTPRTGETAITQSQTQVSTDANLARNWGLSSADWTRFQALMRGPLGVYSPHLDPLTALGLEARSDEERRHFAELQVRAEARRVEKILVYQRAYDAAWKRLYPNAKPVVAIGDPNTPKRFMTQSPTPQQVKGQWQP